MEARQVNAHPVHGSNQGPHHSGGEGLALSRGECLWSMDQRVLEAKGPRKLMRSPFGQEGNGMLVVVALDRVKVPQQAVRLARDAASHRRENQRVA